jgi:hypothetical protein
MCLAYIFFITRPYMARVSAENKRVAELLSK